MKYVGRGKRYQKKRQETRNPKERVQSMSTYSVSVMLVSGANGCIGATILVDGGEDALELWRELEFRIWSNPLFRQIASYWTLFIINAITEISIVIVQTSHMINNLRTTVPGGPTVSIVAIARVVMLTAIVTRRRTAMGAGACASSRRAIKAASTANTHITPINGNDTTESQSNVRKLPKPNTWSFSVKAAFTETKSISKLTTDMPAIGPTSHHTTGSYTDNQQLQFKAKVYKNFFGTSKTSMNSCSVDPEDDMDFWEDILRYGISIRFSSNSLEGTRMAKDKMGEATSISTPQRRVIVSSNMSGNNCPTSLYCAYETMALKSDDRFLFSTVLEETAGVRLSKVRNEFFENERERNSHVAV
uniref:Uncharacterized protein n=1 Tax=Glossina austeni TaxID=7395 RepID=A0A1A9VY22_GLOAU